MKNRSLFLAMATAFVATSFGTTDAKAGSVLLSTLVNTSTGASNGGTITATGNGYSLEFSDFTYKTTGEPLATNVTVSTVAPAANQLVAGAPASDGLTFAVTSGSTYFGGTNSLLLSYTVTVLTPTNGVLTEATLYSSTTAPSSGTGNVTLYQSVGTADNDDNLITGTKHTTLGVGSSSTLSGLSNPTTVYSNTMSTGTIEYKNFTETYTAAAVPEPASLSLLGIGIACYLGFRRFSSKKNAGV